MTSAKTIFILLNGGIGTGPSAQGVPAIQDMVNGLKKEFPITVFSFFPVSKEFRADGYTLIAPSFKLPFIVKFFWIFFRFSLEYFRNKPALLHSVWGYPSGLMGAVFKTVFRKPLIIHLQGGDSVAIPEINYGEFCSPVKAKLLRWAYQKADALIALSEYHKQKIRETGIQKTPVVISFGVDLEKFRPFTKIRKAPFKLLHIASINKVKSTETILNTFAKIIKTYPAHLTIIGEDTLNGKVQAIAATASIKDNVTFTGWMKREAIIPYLQQSDLLLHASLFESQALVVNEALACGLPVCGTKVGLISDLSSSCVVAAPIGNDEELSNAALSLLANEKRYDALVVAGLEWSKKNEARHTIEQLSKLYHQLLA